MAVICFRALVSKRIFAPQSSLKDKRALQEVFESLCEKASVSVVHPQNLNNLCRSKAHKNYPQSVEAKYKEVHKALDSSARKL